MNEFKREKRYQVIKLSNPNWKGSCVVVEDDWPEYEIVWKMIQDRVEGKPNIIEQLQAELAAINSEKESKLQWNDKAQEWKIWPPGATVVMPLPQAAGKVTIVKEKFYPADKELIDKLQTDNLRLREAFQSILPSSLSDAQEFFCDECGCDEHCPAECEYRTAYKILASTDSSNWLAEQKAQWRRELAPSEELAQRFHNRIERGEYHIMQMTFEELWRAINGCD